MGIKRPPPYNIFFPFPLIKNPLPNSFFEGQPPGDGVNPLGLTREKRVKTGGGCSRINSVTANTLRILGF